MSKHELFRLASHVRCNFVLYTYTTHHILQCTFTCEVRCRVAIDRKTKAAPVLLFPKENMLANRKVMEHTFLNDANACIAASGEKINFT